MESWIAEVIKGGGFVAVLAYVWHDAKTRMERSAECFERSLGEKADKQMTAELKHDLIRQIEKIEERQVREVEGLRTEMGDLRQHMDRRFDQLVSILGSKS